MRFSIDFLNEIRSNVSISSIISTRVTFDKKKSNIYRGDFWACCPFHNENTPSFHCDDKKGKYYCFGCGKNGDHFSFLKDIDGISFYESVIQIAKISGISSIDINMNNIVKREQQNNELYAILELASYFFEKNLQSNDGKQARNYLYKRNLSLHIQKIFRIGYASNNNKLKNFLIYKGFNISQIISSGLIYKSTDKDHYYDFFRNRIIFPIINIYGKVIGFGGRIINTYPHSKYLNSPETKIFKKKDTVYNIYSLCKEKKINKNPILIVEGYMDVIALANIGHKRSVATLGTTLTKEQITLIWKFCTIPPILCFDGDLAGKKATFKIIESMIPLISINNSLSFIMLPKSQDPYDIVQEDSKYFEQYYKYSISFSDMLWKKETDGKTFYTPESKTILEKRLYNLISLIKDYDLRRYYFQDMKKRMNLIFFNFNNNHIHKKGKNKSEYLIDVKVNSRNIISNELIEKSKNIYFLRESTILSIIINHPNVWIKFSDIISNINFNDHDNKKLYFYIIDIFKKYYPCKKNFIIILLKKNGYGLILQRIIDSIKNIGIYNILNDNYFEQACQTLKQALFLHNRSRYINKRLNEIELELLNSSESNIDIILKNIRNEVNFINSEEFIMKNN